VAALRQLTLSVAAGELLVLVGPSGCGKTTTLRLLAGLDEPTAGTIRLDGRTVNGVAPRFRDLALVFQRPALYPHLNVRDNLAFGLRLARPVSWWRRLLPFSEPTLSDDETGRVKDVAELLGLSALLDRRPRELSGGEQQRVALGRALARRPGLLLLDEPFSNLDARLRLEMRRQFHLLRRHVPATMIYVTHDQDEALNLGDRVAVLDGGDLRQLDTPTMLLARPADRFVAGFLGTPPMNLLDGRLVATEGRLRFDIVGASWTIERDNWLGFVGRPVTLGARPEDVMVRLAGGRSVLVTDAPGRASLPIVDSPGESPAFAVGQIERLASSRLLVLERDGIRLTALAAPEAAPSEGEQVTATFNAARCHLFDGTTGKALSHAMTS
jgi:multiple sugar transport system ATP-binding protein